jgi:uncharacterized protein (DUF302 family)
MTTDNYGLAKLLPTLSFEDAQTRVQDALADEGFAVLTRIDMAATLHAKLGVETSPYVILGACNPALAAQALEADAHIGLLLPCNVVVRETPAGVEVVLVNAKAMFSLVDDPAMQPIVDEVDGRLQRVLKALD